MKTNRSILLIAFLSFSLFYSTTSHSKVMKTLQETFALSDTVTEMFKDNFLIEAFDLLERFWPLPKNEVDVLKEKSVKMMNTISDRYGDAIDYSLVRNEAISDIASRHTYLIRYENHAIRLLFTFYRNDKGWILNSFKWDDSFEQEFRDVE